MTFCIFLKKNCFYSPSGKDFFILYRFYVFCLCGSLWSLSVATHLKNFIFFYFETPEREGGRGRPKGRDSTKMTKCECFIVHLLCWHVCECVGVWVCVCAREWWLFVYPNVIFNKNSEFSSFTDKNDKKMKGFSSSENGKNATLKCYFPHTYFAIDFFLFSMYYCCYMFNNFAQ